MLLAPTWPARNSRSLPRVVAALVSSPLMSIGKNVAVVLRTTVLAATGVVSFRGNRCSKQQRYGPTGQTLTERRGERLPQRLRKRVLHY